MSDFTKPALNSTYTNFITELKARDNTISSLFSDGTGHTGDYPARAVRWNTGGYFQRRNSGNTAWERLEGASGTHKFVNLQTGALTATNGATITGATSVSGRVTAGSFNVNGSNAPANGMYLGAANELRFTTNSGDRFTIESNGQCGIGTVNPEFTLDIIGDFRMHNGSNSTRMELGRGGTGSSRSAYIDLIGDTTYTDYGLRIIRSNGGANTSSTISHRGTGGFVFEAVEAADMYFQTTNLTRMIIDSGGSVCIGDDASPDDRLHIKQATNSAVYIRVQNNDGYARFGTDANDSFIDADVQRYRTRDGSSDLMRLNTTGLGIGATSFSHKLHVAGTARITSTLQVDGQITGNVTGTATNANNIDIDEKNDNTSYQITFSTKNNTGYNRQYIDTDNAHLNYNPSTKTLSGLHISCEDLTASGTVSLTASDSTRLGNKILSISGNRWGVVPYVDSAGAIEIGKTLDFHATDGSTDNHAARIQWTGSALSFDTDVIPDGSKNLGSTSARWNNLYVNDLKLSNKGGANDVDGTWGDYTIQEGENDLFIKNERNGKVYKMNWTEVEM